MDDITKGIKNICLERNKPFKKGKEYEILIHNIVKKCEIDGKGFNQQTQKELGGASSANDLECIFNGIKVGIEVKCFTSPDWMQKSLKFIDGNWKPTNNKRCKIPKGAIDIFIELLKDIKFFNNKVPPFMKRKITHKEWIKIKKKTNQWDDHYIKIPKGTIKKLYSAKECYYIQISKYGLYHLGYDICNFGVPEFKTKERIRIRTKIHSTENKDGFCDLSVIAACQPTKIKEMSKSKYSLDDINKLPKNLIYLDQ